MEIIGSNETRLELGVSHQHLDHGSSSLEMKTRSTGWRRHLLEWLIGSKFVFSKTLLFLWGFILSHALVNYAVVGVLMDYLTETWQEPSLRKAAMVVNMLDGVSAVLVVADLHISQAYTGRFNMLILCTAAYAMHQRSAMVEDDNVAVCNCGERQRCGL